MSRLNVVLTDKRSIVWTPGLGRGRLPPSDCTARNVPDLAFSSSLAIAVDHGQASESNHGMGTVISWDVISDLGKRS